MNGKPIESLAYKETFVIALNLIFSLGLSIIISVTQPHMTSAETYHYRIYGLKSFNMALTNYFKPANVNIATLSSKPKASRHDTIGAQG